MPPAIIAGGIAAVGTIGGAMLSAGAQKDAASQASKAEQQMAAQNAALAKQFRQENTQNFAPWMQSGGQANALIDSFLYGPGPSNYYTGEMPAGAQPTAPPVAAPAQAPVNAYDGPSMAEINMMKKDGIPGNYENALATYKASHTLAQRHQNKLAQQQAPAQPTTPQNPFSGYAAFVNSPYYQAPLQEGMRQLNTSFAGRGMIESGDAMKASQRYGQDYAYGRMGEYLGLAGSQSDRGLQGASAIAGVGQTALASQSQSNMMAGNAMANAALAKGAANAGMYAGIGNALGGLAGSFLGGGGSSYGGFAGLSDERLKTNIEKVGEFADGLPIVEWNWKSDPNGQRIRGVLAQDVKEYRPHAYIENYRNGFAGVNYGAL